MGQSGRRSDSAQGRALRGRLHQKPLRRRQRPLCERGYRDDHEGSSVKSVLLDNKVAYFAADVSPDQDSTKGIMARVISTITNRSTPWTWASTRLSGSCYRDSTINHGMAFIGVDLRDGEPVKWLVENSWGSSRGKGGLWTMMDNWFDDNV